MRRARFFKASKPSAVVKEDSAAIYAMLDENKFRPKRYLGAETCFRVSFGSVEAEKAGIPKYPT